MFTRLQLTNFTAFAELDWPDHAAMNVIIGENDTGKSHLLKVLYVLGWSAHNYCADKNRAGWLECLASKLDFTFQPTELNWIHLVRKTKESSEIKATVKGGSMGVSISNLDGMVLTTPILEGPFPYVGRTLFIPPKEILTAVHVIKAARNRLQILGFDDTYQDLINDYEIAATYGEIDPDLLQIVEKVKQANNGGEIVKKGLDYFFCRGKEEYAMSMTAEGIKKFGILSHLILNRSILKGSVLLVDEPEANLHPQAIIAMADILFDLSQAGVQVYAATHSYFFLKRIEQRARQTKKEKVSMVDLRRSENGVTASFCDLRDEIPNNPIFAQAERLLIDDIRLDWGE